MYYVVILYAKFIVFQAGFKSSGYCSTPLLNVGFFTIFFLVPCYQISVGLEIRVCCFCFVHSFRVLHMFLNYENAFLYSLRKHVIRYLSIVHLLVTRKSLLRMGRNLRCNIIIVFLTNIRVVPYYLNFKKSSTTLICSGPV